MKTIFLAMLFFVATHALANKTLQCERYTVKEGEAYKQNRTVFSFTLSQDKKSVVYNKISGPDWFLPSGSILKPIWKSKDDLRVVVTWLNSDYEKVDTVWHPVYVMDLDFKKPRYEMETYGGFSDFSELIYSPWKQECLRMD